MKKGVAVIALALIFANLPAFSATPPKAGASCGKFGITKISGGKQFKCIKSGGKLVWNSGKVIKPA